MSYGFSSAGGYVCLTVKCKRLLVNHGSLLQFRTVSSRCVHVCDLFDWLIFAIIMESVTVHISTGGSNVFGCSSGIRLVHCIGRCIWYFSRDSAKLHISIGSSVPAIYFE